jgi:hypothetical protein
VSNPAIAFTNDSDNGLWRPAGIDIIALSAGGVEAMRWSETVGVTTTDVAGRLVVTGSILDLGQNGAPVPYIDFWSTDAGTNAEGRISVFCPTPGDCDMYFGVNSGDDALTSFLKIDTPDSGVSEVHMGDVTGNYVSVSETGAMTFVGTAELDLQSSDASPDSTGEIRHDSTITNLASGGVVWWDGDEVRLLVDLDVMPGTSDFLLFYDAGNDRFESRLLSADIVDNGTTLALNSTFSEWGPFMGDDEEVYKGTTLPLVGAGGDLGIDTDDNTLHFYGNQLNILYPERQSYVICTGNGGTIGPSGATLRYIPPFTSGYFSAGTSDTSRNLNVPVAMSCDEMSVCFANAITDTADTVTTTLRRDPGTGTFVDTALTCDVVGAASGATRCSGADDRIGCSVTAGTPVSFDQYDNAILKLMCSESSCTTASNFYQICFRCWDDE